MTENKTAHTIERAVDVLTGVATNREVIKRELARLPDDDECINKSKVEYEIQLLRIVFTGWAVAYFLADHPLKTDLSEAFWLSLHGFAGRISAMASAGTPGPAVDYFATIRERAQCYTEALNTNMDEADPAIVVGAAFLRLCGDVGGQVVADAGKQVFVNTLNTVKLYLDAVTIEQQEWESGPGQKKH
ncbi:MAG: hypothetical protein AB1724_02415 [Thermodesulfobacteriota bacterium]